MTSTPIQSREDLQKYLQVAIQLEHATIPPYLTALYSTVKPDATNSNLESQNIIRAVVVEEMLHLTLSANMLNAIQGRPCLSAPGFVPNYPTHLPTGETDFEVGLGKFSRDAIETFLKIERPKPLAQHKHRVHLGGVTYLRHEDLKPGRKSGRGLLPHFTTKGEGGEEEHLHFETIGEFYKAIGVGFKTLAEKLGEKALFNGDPACQVGPEYYYSGGGDMFPVVDVGSALAAIDLISEQGEGSTGRIYDDAGELSHYYRFDQISRGRFYRVNEDKADEPMGPEFKVHWDEVCPVVSNVKLSMFPAGSDLHSKAAEFNELYGNLLKLIEEALNGCPDRLNAAFAGMFKIKQAALALIHNPLPGGGHAAPTFEINLAPNP
jgi:hypothetical protein